MSLQEEINHKNIAIVTTASRLTGRTLLKLTQAYLRHQRYIKSHPKIPRGRQTVKKLAGQGQGITTLDLGEADIRKFDRTMRKYGVDYAVMTDKKSSTHTLFFKSKDADGVTKAFTDFTAEITQTKTRQSVLVQLRKFAESIKSSSRSYAKAKEKEQMR